MKKILGFIVGSVALCVLSGFHIVGGEIEFITLEPGLYRINLVQYKDEAQTDNPGYDPSVEVYIFSNKDHRLVSTHVLPQVSINDVPYTNEECSIDELKTSRIIYSADIELNPQDYADPEGYYVVWERCCRNGAIQNIINPLGTGMKYVVEIPPLWDDGGPFINSSPVLLKPLSDYACVGQLYYTKFTGTDLDGDSLVYRMATPLNSSSQTALPIPKSKPHIPVAWRPGFSLDNIVPGSSPLKISNIGLLTVNPSETGVYVFSVIVEEWRDGDKIGEVQRDFQMLVIDGCEPPDPPEVGIQIPGSPDFDPYVDTLKYTLEEDKCFNFIVTNLTQGETISLRAEGVNFQGNIDEIFELNSYFVGFGRDSLIVEVCAPGCPPVLSGPFIVDLIAGDNACPLPQLDTARLMIEVEPPPNLFPTLKPIVANYAVLEDSQLTIDLEATDLDNDSIEFEYYIQGVDDPASRGFSLELINSEAGFIEAQLVWDTDCQAYDFSDRQNFRVAIVAEDKDVCKVPTNRITWLNMDVILPPNTRPFLNITEEDSIVVTDGDLINFDAIATDADNDTLHLRLLTDEFTKQNLGISFEDISATGSVSSTFNWLIDCNEFDPGQNDFEFVFVVEDQDKCEIVNADTVVFKVHVDIGENNSPEFYSYPDTTLEVNVPFEWDISAFDLDNRDSITLEFFNASRNPRSASLSLEARTGSGEVTSTLKWTPECSLLDFGETSAFYDLIFLVYDDGCPIQKLDTMKITFEIKETREQFSRFEPPNVFTPNGDGKNDTFTLSNLPDPRKNLPPDNCDDEFQYISIHDRSGNRVFESTSREFSWDGQNVGVGVYYYIVKYTRTEYKGYLQVLR